MPLVHENFWNLERISCAGLAACVLLSSWSYLAGRPLPIVDELVEVRAPLSKLDVATPIIPIAELEKVLEAKIKRDDPFALPELTQLQVSEVKPNVTEIKPPDPEPKKNPVKPKPNGPKLVLPVKPKPKPANPETTSIATETKGEKPFPLSVHMIVRPDDDSNSRMAVVKKLDGSAYHRLKEGDEILLDGDESLRIVEITPTSVTFQYPDGKLHKIDMDPLNAYKPLLRDETETVDNDKTDPFSDNFEGFGTAPKTDNNSGTANKSPLIDGKSKSRRKKQTLGKGNEDITKQDWEKLLRQLNESKDAGIMERLGEIN